MPRSFEENLALYAKLAVHAGVVIQPGQELILAADIQDAKLARLVAEEAYKLGAKNVQMMYSDEKSALIKFEKGSDQAIDYAPQWFYNGLTEAMSQNAARLGIFGQNPNLLQAVDPEKIAKASKAQSIAAKDLSDYISGFKINWSLIGSSTPDWAKLVFPGEEESVAVQKLWDAIFLVSRVLEDDPIATWTKHCDALEARRDYLNNLKLTSLNFIGPGTDLNVGLADGAVWCGGWGYAKNGVRCAPNIPTEEVFTMPHRAKVDGTVSSTKPLSVRGQVVDGIVAKFKDGEIVEVTAQSGASTFKKLIETDAGARRLGEVALVPQSSATARANILFYNTLYDENAASHIAQGRCYSENMANFDGLSAEEQTLHGANDSLIHVDWMIGSSQIAVEGLTAEGKKVPLMQNGEWVDSV